MTSAAPIPNFYNRDSDSTWRPFGCWIDSPRENYGKRVIHLALRWVLDQPGVTTALWGARHPGQLDPTGDVMRWTLDGGALREIDRIIRETIKEPVGPEFMAPPARTQPIAQDERTSGARDVSTAA